MFSVRTPLPSVDQSNSPGQRIAEEEVGLHSRRSPYDRDGHARFGVLCSHLEVQHDLRLAIRHCRKYGALERGVWPRDVRNPARIAKIREATHAIFRRRARYGVNERDREARRRRVDEEGVDRREGLERDVQCCRNRARQGLRANRGGNEHPGGGRERGDTKR